MIIIIAMRAAQLSMNKELLLEERVLRFRVLHLGALELHDHHHHHHISS